MHAQGRLGVDRSEAGQYGLGGERAGEGDRPGERGAGPVGTQDVQPGGFAPRFLRCLPWRGESKFA